MSVKISYSYLTYGSCERATEHSRFSNQQQSFISSFVFIILLGIVPAFYYCFYACCYDSFRDSITDILIGIVIGIIAVNLIYLVYDYWPLHIPFACQKIVIEDSEKTNDEKKILLAYITAKEQLAHKDSARSFFYKSYLVMVSTTIIDLIISSIVHKLFFNLVYIFIVAVVFAALFIFLYKLAKRKKLA